MKILILLFLGMIMPVFAQESSLDDVSNQLENQINQDNLKELEQKLIADGVITKTSGTSQFKVKLPTTFISYADIKIINTLSVTAYIQQKLNVKNSDLQITVPNIYSITPRLNLGLFETYLPVAINEISGTNVGIGFRLGGFYLGSGSAISAVISNSKQIDFYTGFRWAFL